MPRTCSSFSRSREVTESDGRAEAQTNARILEFLDNTEASFPPDVLTRLEIASVILLS